MCTYNGARFLAAQLDTLLAQDYPNLEIIVNDDQSSDATFDLLLAYAARDARIKPVRNPQNLGYLRNFEACTRRCTGDLIAFCDQDDLWHPSKISRLFAHLGEHDLAVYCDSELMDENGESLGRCISDTTRMYEGSDPAAFVFHNCASGHAMLIRRRLLDVALPYPARGFHDWWLAFAAASLGGIRYLPEPLVRFRQHESSCTDFSGRKSKRKSDGNKAFEDMAYWMTDLARLPSRHQAFFLALREAWLLRAHRLWVPELMRVLEPRSEALLFISKRHHGKSPSYWWRYAVGLPLKQLFRPGKYPRRPLQLPG